MSRLIKMFAFVLAVASSSFARADSIVLNGGFEQNTGAGEFTYSGSHDSTLTNWTAVYNANGGGSGGYGLGIVGTASDFIAGAPDSFGSTDFKLSSSLVASPDGGYFLALDGGPGYAAGVQQTLSLVQGQSYAFSFDWAAAQQIGDQFVAPTQEGLQVSLSDGVTVQTQSVPTYSSLPQGGFSGWMTETFVFTATSSSEVLSFLAGGSPTGEPPITLLDGITGEAVPEPGSMALLGLGVVGLCVTRYRKRRVKAASV